MSEAMQEQIDTIAGDLSDLINEYESCNVFAIDYLNEHDGAVLKVGESVTGQIHCWIYDQSENVTIDVTGSQFDDGVNGAWVGEGNPNVHDKSWVDEFEDADSFRDEYYGTHCPFFEY